MSSEALETDTPSKRTYTKRSPLCRLCLQEYPKHQLEEIFFKQSDCKKQILAAIGWKPHRNDRTTRICKNCRAMVDVIVAFQQVCQRTNELLSQGQSFSWECWKESSERINLVRGLFEPINESGMGLSETSVECQILETIPDHEDAKELMVELLDPVKQEVDEEILEKVKEEVGFEPDDDEYEPEYNGTESESEPEQKPKKKERKKRPPKGKSKRVVCDICGELVSQPMLEWHVNRHLGMKPFPCDVEGCGREMYSKYGLHLHRHAHKVQAKQYECPHCQKILNGYSGFLRHKRLHSEKKYCCEICGKKFHRSEHMKMHSTVHTGIAKFPCEVCGKRFTIKHNLKAHLKLHIRDGTYPINQDANVGTE